MNVHASEERDVRDHWTDPTPQHQWQVTEGAPYNPDTRDEHDESL